MKRSNALAQATMELAQQRVQANMNAGFGPRPANVNRPTVTGPQQAPTVL